MGKKSNLQKHMIYFCLVSARCQSFNDATHDITKG